MTPMPCQQKPRGFTLLEVMVAVTILGLGLTLILSSQAGLFASTRRIENETIAGNLLRCKMSEIEIELETKGFQLLDQHDSGDCCDDEEVAGFSCDWKVETVELPLPTDLLNPETEEQQRQKEEEEKKKASDEAKEKAADAADKRSSTSDATTQSQDDEDEDKKPSSPDAISGALGPLAILSGMKGTSKLIPPGSGPEGLASALGGTSKGGPQGIVSMAMTVVYPTLKPMLEASIRKVTVAVKWQDGEKVRDLSAVQYITNPLEGSLSPLAAMALDPTLQGQTPGATGTGTPSSPSLGIK
jgi:general secretion pathway protein I